MRIGVTYDLRSDYLALGMSEEDAAEFDKEWTKRILRDAGVPTAPFAVIESPADLAGIDLPYPLFVKPVAEGSGKGVDACSRVNNTAELHRAASAVIERFRQPALVETYL